MVGVTSEGQWNRFCHAIEQLDLLDDGRFATNKDRLIHREELIKALGQIFASKPYRWWELRMTKHRVPHGRSLDFSTLRVHGEMNRYVPMVTHAKYGSLHTAAIPIHYRQRPIDSPWLRVDPQGTSTSVEEALASFSEGEQ
jgi:CoA:oxalate CoA-transferase